MNAEYRLVLLSEDTELLALIRGILLERGGCFQVRQVSRMSTVFGQLEEDQASVDGVLVDRLFKDGGVFDFLQRLRELVRANGTRSGKDAAPHASLASLPVIALIGERDVNEDELKAAGAAHLLVKSWVNSPLLHTVLQTIFQLHAMKEQLQLIKGQIEARSTSDSLTQLLNRQGLLKVLDDELYRASRTGCWPVCLYVECDNLKWINESFGYRAGDALLVKIAGCIQRAARRSDHFGRVGGGEFLGILPDTRLGEAVKVGQRICGTVQRITPRQKNVEVSVRIGVAPIISTIRSLNRIVDTFHLALGMKKRQDRGEASEVVVVESHKPEESKRLRELGHWKSTLRSGGDLEVFRQPVFELSTRQVAHQSLLIRGPEGLEAPDQMFAVAQELGILEELDLRCAKSCLQAARALPENVCVHVNVFPQTLVRTPTEKLVELFSSQGASRSLGLDVNTQWISGDPSKLHGSLESLKQAGVELCLSRVDFGRSSLEAVTLLKPRFVKTAPQLLLGLAQDRPKSSLLRRLLGITSSIDAELVALGVERKEDLKIVQEIGIRYAQGFYLEAPGQV